MDLTFSWRKTRAADLAECLKLHPAKLGAEIVGPARATRAWQKLLEMSHATRSAVVEMRDNNRVEIVGFGLGSFVTKEFADHEVRHPQPGLNSRIIKSLVDEEPVIATYDEIRHANTKGELQQAILENSWKDGRLTASQVDRVRVLLGQAYQELFAGYCFSRLFTEMVDELDMWNASGHKYLQVVSRFEDFYRANPETKWNVGRVLFQTTADTMRDHPHSVAAGLFRNHVQPRFGFTRKEQELLELALEGADDAAAAKSLFVTLPAIKRRWSNMFARINSISPDLCPDDGQATRGIQKRHRILTYVRNHPEELRPFACNK